MLLTIIVKKIIVLLKIEVENYVILDLNFLYLPKWNTSTETVYLKNEIKSNKIDEKNNEMRITLTFFQNYN